MKVEQNTKSRRRASAKAAGGGPVRRDPADRRMVADLLAKLPGDSARVVVRASGRLDVMGALSECSGSLVLNMPIGDGVCLAMQPRSDGLLSIEDRIGADSDGRVPFRCQLKELGVLSGKPISPKQGSALLGRTADPTVRCIIGTLVEACREGLPAGPDGGLSMVVGLFPGCHAEVGQHAGLAAATLVAVARIGATTLEPSQAVSLCRQAVQEWLGKPAGAADAACALLGEPNTLAQLRQDPFEVSGSIRLPDDLMLTGIDCGEVHPDVNGKIQRARTAAFMGRVLIDRIIQYEGGDCRQWDGRLSRLSVTDYVERFRDRIPTKLGGREFLDRFGETGDPFSPIDPNEIYKIRSRTEHHIYEHARACQFVECLSRSIRKRDYRILAEAGDLMYASHWSYGQRCGLGSVKTDILVTLLRTRGVDADIFGAKMSGRGCGGIVTVLARRSGRSEAAIAEALDAYHTQTGTKARLLNGSSEGALVAGAEVR